MTTRADWIISSRLWTTESVTIDGSPEDISAPVGALYLLHPTPSLSLLERFKVAMISAGVAAPLVFVTEDRHVRLESAGVFTVTWGAATQTRDLMGFTGDLAGSSAYTAPLRSPLLWSPGKRFTPELAPLGAHGQLVADISVTIGTQGNVVVREEGSPTVVQRFQARTIEKARWWDAPPLTTQGEFRQLWETELVRARKWIVLRDVVEGASSTTSANYSVSPTIGPYLADLSQRDFRRLPFTRAQGFTRVECHYDVTIPAVQTQEYS